MKAWRVAELGEPGDVLTLVDVADPEPAAGQLVVKVLASPANFPDVLMCPAPCCRTAASANTR
jgi:NADPH2:quinone reductase